MDRFSLRVVSAWGESYHLSVYFTDDHRDIKSQTRIYSFAFLSFAVSVFIANVFQHYYFGIMGGRLTTRVRKTLFGKILTFEVEWFDQEDSGGAICARLATDATRVKTLVADYLSLLAQNVSSAILAVVLGLVLSWTLALVAIYMQPLIIRVFYTKAIMMKMSEKVVKAQSKSSGLASEAVGNHSIITAFDLQKILKLHKHTEISPKKESQKQSWYAGLGLFQAVPDGSQCSPNLLVWWETIIPKTDNILNLFQTFKILVSIGMIIALTGSRTSDYNRSQCIKDGSYDPEKKHQNGSR